MSGGTASSVQSPGITQFPPQFGLQNAQQIQKLNANLPQYNLYGQNLPQAQQVGQNLFNNPFASGLLDSAQAVGQLGEQGANNMFNVGGNLWGLGSNVLPGYANTVMQTAMDPQKQLYNFLQNQNQQQAGAINAASGVGTSPYGAGLADQSNQQFNMNWQNQQLGRQLAGLSGATGALGTGANIANIGTQMQAQAPLNFLQSAGLPYNMYNQIGQNQLGALSGLGQYGQQAAQIPQQQIQNFENLIQLAMGGDQNAINLMRTQLGQNQMNWNQLSGLGQGAGQMFGMLPGMGSMFGSAAASPIGWAPAIAMG